MKTYKITYTETLVHHFYVDAESETEAIECFEKGARECEFDFSNGVVDTADYTVEEDE
jgi:hypothetical protein